jgi:predicted phage terminase large subunit-like protein
LKTGHIDVIAEHLQACYEGLSLPQLLINIPPGHAKSLLSSVLFPAWVWAFNPKYRFIFGTYQQDLSNRDAVRTRDLLSTTWYQKTFVRGAWKLKTDSNQKHYSTNTEGGFRLSTSVTGQGTGHRAHMVIIDDPLSVELAYSTAERERANRWVGQTMATRFLDMRKAKLVIIMQRLADMDVSGMVLKEPGWDHLCLRTTGNPNRVKPTSLGWLDNRNSGDLLFPTMFTPSVLKAAKLKLGRAYTGQFEQDPMSDEDTLFKRELWRFWKHKERPADWSSKRFEGATTLSAMELPELQQCIISVDCAFKDKESSSYVVMQVWGTNRADRFLLDQSRKHLSFMQTLIELKRLVIKWPQARIRLVEDKANGPAVMDTLQRAMSGLKAVEPRGDKEARAHAISPQVESGNVFLPEGQSWLDDFVDETSRFPIAETDDQVDAMTQALDYLGNNRVDRLRALGSKSTGIGGPSKFLGSAARYE